MTAPAGIFSAPICALRDLLVSCPSFLGWLGAADEDAARALACLYECQPDPTTGLPPDRFAILDFGDVKRVRVSLTSGIRFEHAAGSTLALYFRQYVAEDATDEDALLTFTNALGAIVEDMEKRAGDYARRSLAIFSIELTVRPTRVEENKKERAGDYFVAELAVTFTRQP